MPTPPASSADDPYDAAWQQPQTQDADAAVNDTTSPRPLVTVATYNEIENLPRLGTEIFRHAPHADLLVIDDNSPDGTGQWCDNYAADDTRLHCLHRAGKLGLGSAIVAGMQYAIEHGYDYVLNMDADFSHDPRYIPDLLAGMDRDGQPPVDVMIGSRYVPGGGIEGWKDASETLNVTVELVRRGYTQEQIEKIWSGNLLRVLDKVQEVAKGLQDEEQKKAK